MSPPPPPPVFWSCLSSLLLTVQRTLRHTQAPGGRSQACMGLHVCSPRSSNHPDCPEPLPDPSLLPRWDLGAWGGSSPLLLSASSAAGACGQQAGRQPCSAVLAWLLATRAGLDPCLPPLRQDDKGVVSLVAECRREFSSGWRLGASHPDEPRASGCQRGRSPSAASEQDPGHDAHSTSYRAPASLVPRLF